MAIETTQGRFSTAEIESFRGWFAQIQALPSATQAQLREDARDLYTRSVQSGIGSAADVTEQSLTRLTSQFGVSTDALKGATSRCPFGHALPALQD